MARPRVIIVGAGFGGLACAQGLVNEPCDVTLIDRNNHHLFQPLLYQVATAGLSPADIAVPVRNLFRWNQNMVVWMGTVSAIDVQTRKVFVGSRDFPYDYLVLAPGARYNYFGHPEWSEVAPSLKTLKDATSIRGRILSAFEKAEAEDDEALRKEWLTFVLVGGGPTGVELSGAIAELARRALSKDFRRIRPASSRIVLCEGAKRILGGFDEKLAAKAQKALEELGVEVITGKAVSEITAERVRVGDEVIRSRTVLWTAGVLAETLVSCLPVGKDRQGRIRVNRDLSVPGFPEVFVIGDSAAFELAPNQFLPAVAPVATQQGRFVAEKILSLIAGSKVFSEFRYFDKGNLATIGRSRAVAEIGSLKISGFPAWVLWLVVHIYYLIGFRNRLLVMIQWAWAYLRFQPGARLIVPSDRSSDELTSQRR